MQPNRTKLNSFFKLKYLFVYFVFILFVVLQVYFFIPSIQTDQWKTSAQSSQLIQPENAQSGLTQDQIMSGIHLVENESNRKGWELTAEEASSSKDELWTLKKIKINFYNDENQTFFVSGDIGEVNGQNKNMIIRGHVKTKSSSGYLFETDELNYDSKEKKLYNIGSVKMTGTNDQNGSALILNGSDLNIFIKNHQMQINRFVEANKNIEGKKFNLKSNSAEFSNQNREAIFKGRVQIKYDDIDLSSPFAQFKYLKNKDKLNTIRLFSSSNESRINFAQNNKFGTCSELIVDLITDTMTLNGSPEVKIDQDTIQGEQIVFTEKGQKVKINKMKMNRKQFN